MFVITPSCIAGTLCRAITESCLVIIKRIYSKRYRGADKSLARPERKQATATEDFDVHISYLQSQLEEYWYYLYIRGLEL